MKRKIFAAGARGFTLVELMIAGAIAAAVSGGAFAIYNAQQISYMREEQFIEAQQNIRAAMYFLEKDVRMSGFDPYMNTLSGFSQAKIGSIGMNRSKDDVLETGYTGTHQTVIYDLANDSNADGIVGTVAKTALGGITTSLRQSIDGGTPQPVIDNVEAVEFWYHLRDGSSKTFTTTAATEDELRNILSVDVTLLVRSRNSIRGFTNPVLPATPGGQTWAPAPAYSHYLHYMLTANIQCRNLGLRETVK